MLSHFFCSLCYGQGRWTILFFLTLIFIIYLQTFSNLYRHRHWYRRAPEINVDMLCICKAIPPTMTSAHSPFVLYEHGPAPALNSCSAELNAAPRPVTLALTRHCFTGVIKWSVIKGTERGGRTVGAGTGGSADRWPLTSRAFASSGRA